VRDPGLTLITLEGIDKSGKSTQTAILANRLRKMGREVETIAFPDYTTVIGRVIKRYLDGEVDFGPELRQLLYVANRWEKSGDLVLWLGKEKLVIADRYTPSGLVYGLANGLNLEWMINLERGLPTSDLVIVVDVSVATAFDREDVRDVYEANRDFLEKVRNAYLALAEKFGWVIVDGEKTKDEVAEEIWAHVSPIA
jgi:dTMP kinase